MTRLSICHTPVLVGPTSCSALWDVERGAIIHECECESTAAGFFQRVFVSACARVECRGLAAHTAAVSHGFLRPSLSVPYIAEPFPRPAGG